MKTNILLKLIIACAKLSGIKPKELAAQLRNDRTRGYVMELYHELGKTD